MGSHIGVVTFGSGTVDPELCWKLHKSLVRGDGLDAAQAGSSFSIHHRAGRSGQSSDTGLKRFGTDTTVAIDGHLFRRKEVLEQLELSSCCDLSDAAIVAEAYRKWNRRCFERLDGEWSIAIHDAKRRKVLLATDFSGTVPLYYSLEGSELLWSSELRTFAAAGRCDKLCTDYLVRYIWHSPELGLTPYERVLAVVPGSVVEISEGRKATYAGWRPDLHRRIRYRSDAEYEDQLRQLFLEAIRERLDTPDPVWAELSGGLDSSAVVCMAAQALRSLGQPLDKLRTVSYRFRGGNSDEDRQYRQEVLRFLGCSNIELDGDSVQCLTLVQSRRSLLPAYFDGVVNLLEELVRKDGARVVLTGEGGDALMWSRSIKCPSLFEDVRDGQWKALTRDLFAFSHATRRNVFDIVFNDVMTSRSYRPRSIPVPEWLNGDKLQEARERESSCIDEIDLSTVSPTVRLAFLAISGMRRCIAGLSERLTSVIDLSHPYLDRNLVQFMLTVPFDQKLRPGDSRSLLRRALKDILPDRLRTRLGKSNAHGPLMRALRREWPIVIELLSSDCRLAELGLVDIEVLRDQARAVKNGVRGAPSASMWSAVTAEMWIRGQEMGD